MNPQAEAVARLLAALTYGERCASVRARDNVRFAPDGRAVEEQTRVAEREEDNCALMEARLVEIGSLQDAERFRPFFDAFFERTVPADWLEAQTWHYVGDGHRVRLDRLGVEPVEPVPGD